MRVTAAAAIAIASVAAACARDEIDAVNGELVPFDLDVLVSERQVLLWVRGPADPSCASPQTFPHPGECVEWSDVVCGRRDECLTRVALERGGDELVHAELELLTPPITLYEPGLFAGGALDLVLEGCGGTARIAIGRSPAPPPTLLDLTTDGTSVRGAVTPTGATGTWAMASTGFTSHVCHEAGDAAWRIAPLGTTPSRAYLSIASIVEAPAVTTPWGDARIFDQTYNPTTTPLVLPVHRADRWELAEVVVDATLTVDGGPAVSSSAHAGWSVRDTPAGRRLHVGHADVDYIAGETTDTLTVVRPDGRYTGTFPHVAPTNDLELALAGDRRVAITFGPVTLTHESNPALTHVVSVDLAWEHGVVPRPEP